MMELYLADKRQKERQHELESVEKKAWKWFGDRWFCKQCLLEEMRGKLSVE
ncbi:hypothetical protein [Paenibacillus thermotolerans]|uniref:hypothetical protein n=1 Tax=Paenibacillus thermotolerans TaxID=3027807 RepID=UPI002367D74A|nr:MULTISPECIES: hypothetical protein [unclassified Paenibacillus]